MNLHLPASLPRSLPDYLPGRVHVLEEDRWPTGTWTSDGVRVHVPRYGLELFVRHPDVDPERVRWHTRRTVHPLEASYVSLLHDRRLYVLKGHHVLAAHLAGGSDRIPVQLFRRLPALAPTAAPGDEAGPDVEAARDAEAPSAASALAGSSA